MHPISTVVLTKNEEKNILRCLKSVVDFSDEVIVLDSYSDDATLDIAGRFTRNVYQSPWSGFSEQRKIAVSKAKNDWILWVDADEEVPAELAEEIKKLDFDADGYFVPRLVFYLGGWVRHCGWYPDYTMRLFDRRKGGFGDAVVHEKFTVQGRTGKLHHPLHHYPYQSISHHLEKMNRYTELAAMQMAEKGKKASVASAVSHCLSKFFKMFLVQRGFLDGKRGVVVCVLGCYYVFLKYIKHWESVKDTRRKI
jgi:glycosyltransferase involved in cell wall biosynthesis